MQTISSFIGIRESSDKTYVEFGDEQSTGNRTAIRTVYGQDAYDLWHLGVRFKEFLAIEKLLQNVDIVSFAELPRKEKFFLHFILLSSFQARIPSVELGCSLLELALGMQLYNRFFEKYNLSIDLGSYYGIELSDLLRQAAEFINSSSTVELSKDVYEFMSSKRFADEPCSLHDLGVGSYAFADSPSYALFINKFEGSSLKLFSCKGPDMLVDAGSKSMTIFSLEKLLSSLDAEAIYIGSELCLSSRQYKTSDNVQSSIDYMLIGNASRIMERIECLRKLDEVSRWFEEKGHQPRQLK